METTNKNLPRDVFLYLLAIVALGMVAVNFGVLLFQFVNVYVPDIISDRYAYPEGYYDAIRWAMAALVIVFPVYFWVTRFLRRDIATNPEKRELKIRKWLLYLTLFVASVVIIGDLVALVFGFLQGELTLRFGFKVLVILSIAGLIFYNYLNELRDKDQQPVKMLAAGVTIAVVAAIVVGLITAGLPQNSRLRRLDEQRVSDLQNIQWQVINHWQNKSQLPANLDALRDTISGFVPPTDPETGLAYEYKVKGSLNFELCAGFKTESIKTTDGRYTSEPVPVAPYPAKNENWTHGVGRECFERIIDPDIYRPVEKPVK